MHRSEAEEIVPCADCGAPVEPGRDRGYAIGGERTLALCWDCAIRRGGAYEEDEDRWVRPPQTDDLWRGEP